MPMNPPGNGLDKSVADDFADKERNNKYFINY